MSQGELNALINLLDDPDEGVFSHVTERLLTHGPHAIPFLEMHWERSMDHLLQSRIEQLIHRIQFDNCKAGLARWVASDGSLLDGALLLASYQYPDMNADNVRSQLARIRTDIWIELNDRLMPIEQIRVMNHILFAVHGFSGNTQNYHAPQNSFINIVMESHKGNPLSLSIVYLILSEMLGLPIVGINLPEHFVVGYRDEADPDPSAMLFYVNPFSRGGVFGKAEVVRFLRKMGLGPEPRYIRPATPIDMMLRLTNNLLIAYGKLGDTEKAEEMKQLQAVLQGGAVSQ